MATNPDVTPDVVIEFTQLERLKLLEDEKDTKLRLAILNSLSSTALTTKRIIVDETNAITEQEIASVLSSHLLRLKDNPYAIGNGTSRIPSVLISDDIQINLDETSTCLADLDIDLFD